MAPAHCPIGDLEANCVDDNCQRMGRLLKKDVVLGPAAWHQTIEDGMAFVYSVEQMVA